MNVIRPICRRCGNELMEYGALLFSPPDDGGFVSKGHLCVGCYRAVIDDMDETGINFGDAIGPD